MQLCWRDSRVRESSDFLVGIRSRNLEYICYGEVYICNFGPSSFVLIGVLICRCSRGSTYSNECCFFLCSPPSNPSNHERQQLNDTPSSSIRKSLLQRIPVLSHPPWYPLLEQHGGIGLTTQPCSVCEPETPKEV